MPVEATTVSTLRRPNMLSTTPTTSIRPEPEATTVTARSLIVVKRRHRPAANTPNEVSKLSSAPLRSTA